MKRYPATAFLFFAFVFSTVNIAQAEKPEPKVTGMYFYASWCAACKALEPKLSEATLNADPLVFGLVKFDVSNKKVQHESKLRAAELNLESKYDEIGVKTGFVILVDSSTGKEIGRIKRSDKVELIKRKIESAAGKVEG